MEHQKRSICLSACHDVGLTFAPGPLVSQASSVRTYSTFRGALLTMSRLHATRSRLSFKFFPISILIPRLLPKLLSNVCKILSMRRPHSGSWLLFFKGCPNGYTVAPLPSGPCLPTNEHRDFDSPLCVMVCNKTGQHVIRMTPLRECVITRSYCIIKMTTV